LQKTEVREIGIEYLGNNARLRDMKRSKPVLEVHWIHEFNSLRSSRLELVFLKFVIAPKFAKQW